MRVAPVCQRFRTLYGGVLNVQRFLIIAGVVLLAAGLAWPWVGRLGLERLPGDINIKRDGFGFPFPIVTSVIVSLALTLLIWLFRK